MKKGCGEHIHTATQLRRHRRSDHTKTMKFCGRCQTHNQPECEDAKNNNDFKHRQHGYPPANEDYELILGEVRDKAKERALEVFPTLRRNQGNIFKMTNDLYQRWEEAKRNHSHISRDIDTVINEVRGNPNKIPSTNPKTTREMSRLMLINTKEQGIWPWQPLKEGI